MATVFWLVVSIKCENARSFVLLWLDFHYWCTHGCSLIQDWHPLQMHHHVQMLLNICHSEQISQSHKATTTNTALTSQWHTLNICYLTLQSPEAIIVRDVGILQAQNRPPCAELKVYQNGTENAKILLFLLPFIRLKLHSKPLVIFLSQM